MENNSTFPIYLIPEINYISSSTEYFHNKLIETKIDTVCECYGTLVKDLQIEVFLTGASNFGGCSHLPSYYTFERGCRSPNYGCSSFTLYNEHELGSLNFSDKESLFESIRIFRSRSSFSSQSLDYFNQDTFDEYYELEECLDNFDEEKYRELKEEVFDLNCFESIADMDLAFEIILPRELLTYKEFHQSINIECDNFYDCKNECSECKYYRPELYSPCTTNTLGINPMLLKNFNFWKKS